MLATLYKYAPSICTALIGLAIFILVPFQIDLSHMRGSNLSGIDARTLPYLLSFSIIFLSFLEMIIINRKKEKESNTDIKSKYSNILRVCITFLSIVLWILLVPFLGFIISMIILLVFVMMVMGNRKILQLTLVPVITSVLLNYIFTTFLGRTLPTGIFF
ncbi:tripartite tricarboxylate transporter TctB family protein [Halomonas sp. SpR8]|uniref:tripartite tricarboxylate transporter TctB family protein n=1 Tax=Halomonas sp. SpR8 TaxID=3050463 RepID=UPI0035B13002